MVEILEAEMNEKFKWGSKVVSTKAAIKGYIVKKETTGVCLGYHKRTKLSISVVKKGQKTPNYYSVKFLRPK